MTITATNPHNPATGNFDQRREDQLDRELATQERAELRDPDFDTVTEYDDYYDFDEAASERAEAERDMEQQRAEDRADDFRFEREREADYEAELANRAASYHATPYESPSPEFDGLLRRVLELSRGAAA